MGFSLKKLFSPVTNAVRGLGRIARGKFSEGLSDIGGAAKVAAPVLGLTGVGLPIAALVGGAGGLLKDKSLGGALGGAALGAGGSLAGSSGLLGKLGGLGKSALNLGGKVGGALYNPGTATDGAAGGGAGGLTMLGKLLLGGGMTGLSMAGTAAQNRSANQWNQGLLNLLTSGIGSAESGYQAKQGMRDAAYAAIARGLSGGGDIFSTPQPQPQTPSANRQGLRSALKSKREAWNAAA